MKYNLVSQGDDSNLTAFIGGEMYTANSEHPNWTDIVEKVLAGDESVVRLFSVVNTISENFEKVSERISVKSDRVYFDGEEVDNALTKQILRFMKDDVEDWKPLVAFFEKVATNPNEHSREQLFRWLDRHDFTITDSGDIVGYKGVQKDSDGAYKSISHGRAIVNGEPVNGAVPNPVGGIVEMPRSDVQHDPSVGCHTGLHVGTWDYAKGFARGAVLEVHVNPRDVVSVPTDCHDQKVRTCRYTVIGEITSQYDSPYLGTGDGEPEAIDEDDCEDYGW